MTKPLINNLFYLNISLNNHDFDTVGTPSFTATKRVRVVKVPQQKVFNDVSFPLVVQPSSATPSSNLAEVLRAHKSWVEAKLHESGAVLFRGFEVTTASDFNDVVESFGYEEFPFTGVSAHRSHVVGRIYTSNNSPPHLSLHFHNKMAYLENNPSKAFFYCEVEPGSQGETPIVLGHIVYERLKRNHSDFLQRLEKHGVIYNKLLPNDDDNSSPIGQSWKTTFSTNDKAIAEQKAGKLGLKLEWLENGAKLGMKPLPAIKIDKSRAEERRVWFNSIMPAYTSQMDARYNLENPVIFGDNVPIPQEVVEECEVILEEECVAIPWRKGDVLILDNYAVQHSRRPFTLPRRVLATFTK